MSARTERLSVTSATLSTYVHVDAARLSASRQRNRRVIATREETRRRPRGIDERRANKTDRRELSRESLRLGYSRFGFARIQLGLELGVLARDLFHSRTNGVAENSRYLYDDRIGRAGQALFSPGFAGSTSPRSAPKTHPLDPPRWICYVSNTPTVSPTVIRTSAPS